MNLSKEVFIMWVIDPRVAIPILFQPQWMIMRDGASSARNPSVINVSRLSHLTTTAPPPQYMVTPHLFNARSGPMSVSRARFLRVVQYWTPGSKPGGNDPFCLQRWKQYNTVQCILRLNWPELYMCYHYWVANLGLMYDLKAFEAQRPLVWITGSGIPSMSSWVAFPMRNECVLNVWRLAMPQHFRHFLNTAANWYLVRPSPLKFGRKWFECLGLFARKTWRQSNNVALVTFFSISTTEPLPRWSVF